MYRTPFVRTVAQGAGRRGCAASTSYRVARVATPLRRFSQGGIVYSKDGQEDDRQPGPSGSSSAWQERADPRTQPPSTSTDPFPMPFSPHLFADAQQQASPETSHGHPSHTGVNLSSTHQINDLPIEQQVELAIPRRVPGRENEERERKIARLIYQTRKRGILETDLLLSTFAKKELKGMSEEMLDEFDLLLDEPDWDIFYWSTKRKSTPPQWTDSFETKDRLGWRLRKHTANEEKLTRRMPELEL